MVDACIIDRVTGEVLNETTGQMTPTYATIYTGMCRVQAVGTQAGSPNAGEHQFTVVGHVIQLPIDTTVYRVADRVRLTVATLDPALVGVALAVASLTAKSHATMRRLICDEVIS
jgi:hypothetical protein